jgi:hypothetical protein
MNTISFTAPPGSEAAHAIGRIKYLRDPGTLNALLDGFQELGMPLGSDRWAEHCLALLRELYEKSCTLNEVQNALKEATQAGERCQGALYRRQRQAITKEFQEARARKEREDETRFREELKAAGEIGDANEGR